MATKFKVSGVSDIFVEQGGGGGGSSIAVDSDGVPVGNAQTLNFENGAAVTIDGGNPNQVNVDLAGLAKLAGATFTGNVQFNAAVTNTAAATTADTGTITVVASASYVNNDSFSIPTPDGTIFKFAFQRDGTYVPDSNITATIDVQGSLTTSGVAQRILNAFTTAGLGSFFSYSRSLGVITVTSLFNGNIGGAITSTVADPGFIVTGFSGGDPTPTMTGPPLVDFSSTSNTTEFRAPGISAFGVGSNANVSVVADRLTLTASALTIANEIVQGQGVLDLFPSTAFTAFVHMRLDQALRLMSFGATDGSAQITIDAANSNVTADCQNTIGIGASAVQVQIGNAAAPVIVNNLQPVGPTTLGGINTPAAASPALSIQLYWKLDNSGLFYKTDDGAEHQISANNAVTFEKSETGSDANVLTYTAGATDEFLVLNVAVDDSSFTGTNIIVQVAWTDSNGTNRTANVLTITGAGSSGTCFPLNVKTATNVVVSTTFTGVSVAYKITATLVRQV